MRHDSGSGLVGSREHDVRRGARGDRTPSSITRSAPSSATIDILVATTLLLVLASPLIGSWRSRSDSIAQARASTAAGAWPGRAAVRHAQVPEDARRRPWPGALVSGRRALHPAGPLPRQDETRRAAAALECPQRRDEPGRALAQRIQPSSSCAARPTVDPRGPDPASPVFASSPSHGRASVLDPDDRLGHYVNKIFPQKIAIDSLYAKQRTAGDGYQDPLVDAAARRRR